MDGGDNATVSSPIERKVSNKPMPGLVFVTIAWEPVSASVRWQGNTITLGRNTEELAADLELSRLHVDVTYFGDRMWRVIDRGTKNGTYVDGMLLNGRATVATGDSIVVRMGGTVLLLEETIERYSYAQM